MDPQRRFPRPSRPLSTLASCLVLLVGTACGDDGVATLLPGGYGATTFTLSGAVTGDVLAAGGFLQMLLQADGTTSGTLSIPASLAEGTDFEASMVGTWRQEGSVVRFSQEADTFVRDIIWEVVSERQLRGQGTFSSTTITVVLELLEL